MGFHTKTLLYKLDDSFIWYLFFVEHYESIGQNITTDILKLYLELDPKWRWLRKFRIDMCAVYYVLHKF